MFTEKKLDTPAARALYDDIHKHTEAAREGLMSTEKNVRLLSQQAYTTVSDPKESVKLIAQKGGRILLSHPLVLLLVGVGGALALGYRRSSKYRANGFATSSETNDHDYRQHASSAEMSSPKTNLLPLTSRLKEELVETADVVLKNVFSHLRQVISASIQNSSSKP